ncbi:AAA family ATPase [Facilibium subflavum]|uniref:AAA family ATPase n=1 Tax=Facilibium subflavum TaxID=2219058 RepID=UPI000E6516ED|nr:AAA family ATPase [Facilibium subflavum]
MSVIHKVYDAVENLFSMLSSLAKQSIDTYCDLDSADSEDVLVTKSGALVSVIEMTGLNQLISWSSYLDLSERLNKALQPLFNNTGHSIQVNFVSDPSKLTEDLVFANSNVAKTSQLLNLNLEDVLISRKKTLQAYCHHERCYITLWTLPKALPTLKQSTKSHAQKVKKIAYPIGQGKQRILNVLSELRITHKTATQNLLENFRECGFYVHLISGHQVVADLRKRLYPNDTAKAWLPFLPGDPATPKLNKLSEQGLSAWLWPSISEQIFPKGADNLNIKSCEIGGYNYSAVLINLFPKDVQPFVYLMRELNKANIPWQFSTVLSEKGIDISKSKAMFAKLLAFSSYHNRLLVNSHDFLKYLEQNGDDPIIKISVVLTTWAPKNDKDLLEKNESLLSRLVQGWGGCETSLITGDPFAVVTGSLPAMNHQHLGTVCACPLSEALKFMPFTMPASPWDSGSMLFRTPSGKLWPYQPGSDQQISWVDLIYARSGSGKSVLSNALNLAACLSPGLDSLPYVGIIDVGPSAKGLASLLQYALPKEQRSQIVYHKLSFSRDHACNPFDTILGARVPTRMQQHFLLNFINLLVLDPDADKLPEDVSSMVSLIIAETYKYFSDNYAPKPYLPNMNTEVDKKMAEFANIDDIESWWQVVDLLFDHKEYVLAQKAQYLAMPSLSDTVTIANFHVIRDIYGKIKAPSGENYIEWYARKVSSIVKSYPHLNSPTVLQIADAKLVIMDLDNVARQGSALANKQTSIAYMQARHIVAQHLFTSIEDLSVLSKRYYAYHCNYYKSILNQPKRLVYDEFHRTQGIKPVRDQILRDMREGRKWKIQISLSSQSLSDFDQLMLEFATSTFILDGGTQDMLDKTASVFGLNSIQKQALKDHVTGPKRSGVNFLAQFVTKSGMNTQLLTATLGAVELWALTTTTEDAYIRDCLYELTDRPDAVRNLLAKRFPDGTVKSYVALMQKKNPDKTVKVICREIIDEMFDSFTNQPFKNLVEGHV